ncbi:helix-turn-helix transcriptional regulator [Vibrio maerlii]|uniref:helix-turn-helix transcriptional regulator n=1 Tax=Vibrio maerlii TaxID=2231648 RepID=UPI000E3DF121|nr:AraC family transcriptional regulator [Vibrio maerlii]
MITLINKHAAIILIETLQNQVVDAWPLINRAQVPIYLDTSPVKWTNFRSLLNLLEESRDTLPALEFIKLIQNSALKFAEYVHSHIDGEAKSLSVLVEQIPVRSISVNTTTDKVSIELAIPIEDESLFLAELYLLAVTHFYLKANQPNLDEPIQYHLKFPQAAELNKLQANSRTPQFLGQNQTAVFYRTTLEFETFNQRYKKEELSYSQQVLSALEGYIGRENLTIEQFGEIVGVSERTIQRHLKSEGMTFRKIKESLNVAFAKRVMIQRDASISDVSEHLGYADTSQFIRAFKKSENITPYQWLKGMRSE